MPNKLLMNFIWPTTLPFATHFDLRPNLQFGRLDGGFSRMIVCPGSDSRLKGRCAIRYPSRTVRRFIRHVEICRDASLKQVGETQFRVDVALHSFLPLLQQRVGLLHGPICVEFGGDALVYAASREPIEILCQLRLCQETIPGCLRPQGFQIGRDYSQGNKLSCIVHQEARGFLPRPGTLPTTDVAKIEQIPFHEKSRIHGREGSNFSRYSWHKEPQPSQIDRQIVLVGLYVQLRNQRAAGLFVSPGSLVQLSHGRSNISAVLKRDI